MAVNSDFLEKMIVKGMLESKEFLVLISQTFEKEYFDDTTVGEVFSIASEYVKKYKKIPPKDVIKNSVTNTKDMEDLFKDIDKTDYSISEHYDSLLDDTNEYLKEQAMKNAIIESVSIIEDNGDKGEIRKKIEDAICKDLKIDLGLRYINDLGRRLKEIKETTTEYIPTYYTIFDEMISGGFPKLSLSIISSKIHGMKSTTLANFAARQMLHGHNIVLMTLEMSEKAFAQRVDSILSSMDINRMYVSENNIVKLYGSLKSVISNDKCGELYIKEFPTGAATVNDMRKYLRELNMRGVEPSILYIDYINLMSPEARTGTDLYSSIKKIAEELRALSFEFSVPVISVTQLNREGMFTELKDLDFRYISESIATAATADFLAIYGTDEDAWLYENTLLGKIVKNRFGMLDMFKFFYDSKTLKLYDESEEDLWRKDAQKTGDVEGRKFHKKESCKNS